MATKTKLMFVMLPEFIEWMRELGDSLAGSVLLCHGPDRPMTIWKGSKDELQSASRVYFVEAVLPVHDVLTVERLNVAELGWVQIDVPRLVDQTLLLCQVATKSDWWDKKQFVTRENRLNIPLHEKVWRVLKPRLTFPVWATNVRTGATSVYRTIGCSNSARDWYRRGGKLGQEGVANIEYRCIGPNET